MTKAPLVFLHGFPFNGSCWDLQVKQFEKDYRVYAPDLRGHGSAHSPEGPWMIAHFADDLKAFLDKEKIEKAIVCGLSMGGYIALHFVAQYPDQVAALILCDTRADADSNEAKDKRYAAIQKIEREGLSNFSADFSRSVLCESTLEKNPQLQTRIQSIILQNKPENVSMTLGALASRRDSTPYLDKIVCRTLVLVGAEDKITPPEVNEFISHKIKGAKFSKIQSAGHLSNMEQPQIFNEAVAAFLSD